MASIAVTVLCMSQYDSMHVAATDGIVISPSCPSKEAVAKRAHTLLPQTQSALLGHSSVPSYDCAYLLVHVMLGQKGGRTSAQCELQMNGMGMGLPPNPMMNQQGMHPHMMGQQPQGPGVPGMMPPQNGSQAVGTSSLNISRF